MKINSPMKISKQFWHYKDMFKRYYTYFAFLETLNLVMVIASIQVTHWLLNNKFWYYGLEVIMYLNNYQSFQQQGRKLHDPMCEVFPTEVRKSVSLLDFIENDCYLARLDVLTTMEGRRDKSPGRRFFASSATTCSIRSISSSSGSGGCFFSSSPFLDSFSASSESASEPFRRLCS